LVDGEPVVLKFLGAGTDITEYARARVDFLNADSRVLPPVRAGDEVRVFHSLVNEMVAAPPPAGVELPISGPATAEWFLHSVAVQGSDLLGRHQKWRQDSHVR
jgi:hypothetical protein